jgi:hypothetical protein
MALLIGFFVALFMNVDSISLTGYLWREPAVRAVLATKAQEFELSITTQTSGDTTNAYQAMQDFQDQFSGLNLPIGWTLKEKTDPIFQEPGAACTLMPKAGEYFGVSLSGKIIPYFKDRCFTTSQPDHSTNIFLKFLGILITAIAAQQGAPFWFDVLKKFINLRGTGANPAEKGK